MVLRHMRKNIAKFHWLLWIVIASFILVYGYQYNRQKNQPAAEPVLKVNGHEIPLIQVQRDYQSMLRYFKVTKPEQRKMVLNMALNSAIGDALMNQIGDQLSITVTRSEVDENLRSQIQRLKDQVRSQQPKISEKELDRQIQYFLKQTLAQQGYNSSEEYRAEVARNLRSSKVRSILGAPVTVSEEAIREEYKRLHVTAKLQIVLVNADRFKERTPDEKTLSAYFAAHRKHYTSPSKRKITVLKVMTEAFKPDVKVSKNDIQSYYQAHRNEFLLPERVRARHILISTEKRKPDEALQLAEDLLKQLKAGASFEKLAKQYSEDPGSKEQGGELGWFTHGRMVKTFENAAFAAQIHHPVGPIHTRYGYHIIEVEARESEHVPPVDQVKDKIVKKIVTPKATHLAEIKATSLSKTLHTQGKARSIDKLLEGKKVIRVSYPPFEASTEKVPKAIRDEALKLQKIGTWSEIVRLPDGFGFVHLDKRLPAQPMSLKEARKQVLEDYNKDYKRKLAKEKADKVYQAAQAEHQDLKKAAEHLNLEAKDIGPFPETGPVPSLDVESGWAAKVFTLPIDKVMKPEKNGEQGYFVYKVTEKKPFDQKEYEAARKRIRLQLINQARDRFQQSLMETLKAKADIQRNERLIKDIQ